MPIERHHTLCRICSAHCPLVVETNGDDVLSIHGDKDNPVYFGFSCIKGREAANIQHLPSRLRSSLKRAEDGRLIPISWRLAATEAAERLEGIITAHGPRSVAAYLGTYAYFGLTGFCFGNALMDAIGSRLAFHSGTIDQPGKVIGPALHGLWLAGTRPSDTWDALVLLGTNPLISMNGGLGPNPARQVRQLRQRGMKLIVIDPRQTETARQADIFLQCRPGTDAQIMAGLAHILIKESLCDEEFVKEESSGLGSLAETVEPFTPSFVAQTAGIREEDLVAAAHILGAAQSGVVSGGTGINMSGQSSLAEYLIKVLMTLRGWWVRAGEPKSNPGVLVEPFPPIAASPGPMTLSGFGETMRVRGLQETLAGVPTAVLPDEILTDGPGQVKALIVIGGNPLAAFPDQIKTKAALDKLELLICIDPALSGTAKLADYVFAPKMALEVQGTTAVYEWFGNFLGSGFGYERPYAQISQPVLPVPPESDLAEDWEFIFAMARHMGRPLAVKPISILDPVRAAAEATPMDMAGQPTSDDIWRMILKGAPVPYDEVRRTPEGRLFERPSVIVQEKPPGWPGRLDLAAPSMMAELGNLAHSEAADEEFPFRLISRRMLDVINSNWHENPPQQRTWTYNPAFMHPSDLEALGAEPLDVIEITSDRAKIRGIVQSAPDVRPGCISMSHCWGKGPDELENLLKEGSNICRLVSNDRDFDQHSGIPVMSGIPVRVSLIKIPMG